MYNPLINLSLTKADKHEIAETLINEGVAEDCLNNLVKDCELAKIIRQKMIPS